MLLRAGDDGELTPQHVLGEARREVTEHRLRRRRQRHDRVDAAVEALDDGDLVHLRRHEAVGEGRREGEGVHVWWRWMVREGAKELNVFRRRRRRQRRARVDGHAAAATRRRVVPHVRAHVHLQVAFRRERLAAHRALERLVARVRAHVDLQRAGARERLLAHHAHVLEVGPAHERRLTVVGRRAGRRDLVLLLGVSLRRCLHRLQSRQRQIGLVRRQTDVFWPAHRRLGALERRARRERLH